MIKYFTTAKRSVLQQYIKEARKYKLLSRAEERAVVTKVKQGNKRAIHKLINCNLMFVIKIAYKYRNQGLDIEDLISAGNLGIIEAAKRMSSEKDNKFITYAVWWIRQSIRQQIFNQGRLIRIASNQEEKLRQLYRNSFPLKNYIGSTGLDWEKIANVSDRDFKHLLPLLQLSEAMVSLDAPTQDEKTNFVDFLESNTGTPETEFEKNEKKDTLHKVAASLDSRENQILTNYFGLNDTKQLSLAQIAELVDLSKERVRQIKDTALIKLRKNLRDRQRFSFA